ncbi:MAG: type II toxin-antitoxin system VapC family toxin [Candidatus Schekmanbacteria bacterium]|nr:type II toxin-antitoxin system VapC family toxin [Candidatus Schekmanbacteria bacterium]
MKKLKIYLDTSVINFLFADDAPGYQNVTKSFFAEYLDEYEIFISEIVLAEISETPQADRKKLLLSALETDKIRVIENDRQEEISALAAKYIKSGIIPPRKQEDALHVAFCTVYEIDILLSWNFKHLANIKKQILINAINETEGYQKRLYLLNPLEVVYEK